MSAQVPQITNLKQVYAGSPSDDIEEKHLSRWNGLLTKFEKVYDHKADFVSRSPGRVNIIGEHVDYSLYNVLPTALMVDVLIAVRTVKSEGNPSVKVANINEAKYASSTVDIPPDLHVGIDKENHEWSNYFKAGLDGALEFLRKSYAGSFSPRSMEILVDGNVPAGGGLSSSAAFVCASALAVMKANGHDVSKQDLLDLAIVSEREVGVYSGGMDQAASIFSEQGFLLYCRFFPSFSAEHVPVPISDPEFTFLVAQSFVTSDKAVTAPKHYNLRVVEVTLAAVVLAKLYNIALSPDHSSLSFSLRNFQQEMMVRKAHEDRPLPEQVDDMIAVAKERLTQPSYTREDIAKILDLSVETLEKTYMSKFPVQADDFLLRQRALHVFEEARRVLFFKEALSTTRNLNEEKLRYLGDLMNQTQDSCRDVFECSCPELDEICTIARRAGAYGSRLTGAGWGGCTVHLVPQKNVQAVTEALKKEYYFKRFRDISEEQLTEAIVTSKPSQGSSIILGEALNV